LKQAFRARLDRPALPFLLYLSRFRHGKSALSPDLAISLGLAIASKYYYKKYENQTACGHLTLKGWGMLRAARPVFWNSEIVESSLPRYS